MQPMKREEIEHLAGLARIKLTEEELSKFETELSSIVSYVGAVSEMIADEPDSRPQVGPRYNVFRSDEETNEPDQFTEAILAEMPHTEGRFMKVKKILKTED